MREETGQVMLETGVDHAVLRCPRCGGANLHHGGVAIFDRVKEDDPKTIVTTFCNRTIQTSVGPTKGSGNPSSRRGGLSIGFWCEHCDGGSDWREHGAIELTISQHKGETQMAWRWRVNRK